MIFICPHCNNSLEASGRLHTFMCLKCDCIFLVKIEIQEIKGPRIETNIRQLPSTTEDEGSPDTDSIDEESVSCGASSHRESDIP